MRAAIRPPQTLSSGATCVPSSPCSLPPPSRSRRAVSSRPRSPSHPSSAASRSSPAGVSAATRPGGGTVTVQKPGASTSSDRLAPSLSLLGGDAIDAFALSGLGCTQVSKNPNVKRCAFDLEVRNKFSVGRLRDADRLPEGAAGDERRPPLSRSAPRRTAPAAGPRRVPTGITGPANFFNDAAGCNSGGKSDCYRYELIPAPFYAATSTTSRRSASTCRATRSSSTRTW